MTIELQLPRDINDVPLKEWQKYTKIWESNQDTENDFLEIKMLEIFGGLKYKDISLLGMSVFDNAIAYMQELFNANTPLVNRFSLTGSDGVEVEFGFIPNLDKMTMGEYIDLNNYLEEADTLHKAMAVLFRPVHKDYKNKVNYRIDSYKGAEKYAEIMKDMPLGRALRARVYFYRLGIKLSKAILSSFQASEEFLVTLSEEEQNNLTKNIAGIKSYTLLLEESLLKLSKPL